MDPQDERGLIPAQNPRAAYLLRSSSTIAGEAFASIAAEKFDRAVRKTQEAVELLLESRLAAIGVAAAKTHDLVDLAALLPSGTVPVPASELSYLTEERIPSFYGAENFVPDEAYDASDGERCLAILRALGLLE